MPEQLGYAQGLGCTVAAGALLVPGVCVGCVTHEGARTGLTLVLLPPGSRGAVDVAGGAPATRETDLLRPENLVQGPDAVLLTGGSAFGLRAADGVMQVLAEAGRGVAVGAARVPIVPSAAIFDLGVGDALAPTPEDGAQAARRALEGGQAVPEGRQGAGCGATVGKALGPERAMAGGQGALTLTAPDGLAIGALAVVNALGSILSHDGSVAAGPRVGSGAPTRTAPLLAAGGAVPGRPGEATTLVLVATNARLSKAELVRVARMAHDGLARAIDPAHTLFDGDTVFCASCGDHPADATRAGALAAAAVAQAIVRAVR